MKLLYTQLNHEKKLKDLLIGNKDLMLVTQLKIVIAINKFGFLK
jgi:hypothetical protein